MPTSPAGPSATMSPQGTLSLLRDRNFSPYLAGNLISSCGTWVQNIALALLAFRLTGSALVVGLVNFAQFVPVVLLAPWSGAAADRFDRRRWLMGLQLAGGATCACFAVLAWTDLTPVVVVLVFAFAIGAAGAFGLPTIHALLPQLVEPPAMPKAVALNSITFNGARAIGPIAGAAIVAGLGIPAALAANALSFLTFALGLKMVKPRAVVKRDRATEARPRMMDGVRVVRSDRRLLLLLIVVGVTAIAADPVTTLAPSIMTGTFGRPDTDVGLLMGAFGFGAIVAGLTTAGRLAEPAKFLPFSCSLLGAGIMVFSLSPGLLPAMVALAVAGFGFLLTGSSAAASMHLLIDDGQRGRIMALWSVAWLGTRPAASVLDGFLAETVGARGAGVALAAPVSIAAVALLVSRQRGGLTASLGPER